MQLSADKSAFEQHFKSLFAKQVRLPYGDTKVALPSA
jgi:hypothetical protein